MSPISGHLTPEARATLDAVLAKLAAPGMCNSADDEPCISGTPPREAIQGDTRTAGQRNHDALVTLARAALASGELGQHNGLPTSNIVTTTLKELEAGAGRGLTAGGTLLPMSDVIRLASTPITTWPSSTTAKHWRSITPSGWPHRLSELCCTPTHHGVVGSKRL